LIGIGMGRQNSCCWMETGKIYITYNIIRDWGIFLWLMIFCSCGGWRPQAAMGINEWRCGLMMIWPCRCRQQCLFFFSSKIALGTAKSVLHSYLILLDFGLLIGTSADSLPIILFQLNIIFFLDFQAISALFSSIFMTSFRIFKYFFVF
jgi:hypothetical protein